MHEELNLTDVHRHGAAAFLQTAGEIIAGRVLKLREDDSSAYETGQAGAAVVRWDVAVFSYVDTDGVVSAVRFTRSGRTWIPQGLRQRACVDHALEDQELGAAHVLNAQLVDTLDRAWAEYLAALCN